MTEKKVLTPEHLAALAAGRERARERKAAGKLTPNEERRTLAAAEKLAAESRSSAEEAVEAVRLATEKANAAVAAADKITRRIPNPAPIKMIVGAPPPPRGHQRKFGPEAQRTYLDARARGINKTDSAKLAGVTLSTVAALRKVDPSFVEAELEAEEGVCDLVEEALFQAALAGNVEAMKTILFNRAKERWQPPQKMQLEVTGQVDHSYDVGAGIERIAQLQATLAARAAGLRELEPPILDAEEYEPDGFTATAVADRPE